MSDTTCECGGKLELVIVQNASSFEDEEGKRIRIADSEEVWRCEECKAEYTFGDEQEVVDEGDGFDGECPPPDKEWGFD